MKKSLLTTAIVSFTLALFAQQDPQLTFWMYDKQSFNPAGAGFDPNHCATLIYRNQWTGFDNSPRTTLFNYSGNYAVSNFKFGAGITFFNDQLGQETNNNFRLHIAPKFDLGGKTLALGVTLGAMNKALGNDWNPIDPVDEVIPSGEISQIAFDMSFGAMIYEQGKYYFGVSATHLTAPELDELSFKSARHFYAMGGYNFPVGSSPFVIRTNALVKSDLAAQPAFDLNANVLWNNLIFGGLTFRPGDAISPMAGMEYCFAPKASNGGRTTINQCLRLGYSYDITTSELRNYSSGSHEVFVTYCFNFETSPIRSRHNNPRFL